MKEKCLYGLCFSFASYQVLRLGHMETGSRFKVSYKLVERGVKPATPGLQGEWLIYLFTTQWPHVRELCFLHKWWTLASLFTYRTNLDQLMHTVPSVILHPCSIIFVSEKQLLSKNAQLICYISTWSMVLRVRTIKKANSRESVPSNEWI